MRVFVTGGSGFIGGEVVDQLVKRGADVCNYDVKAPVRGMHMGCWREGNILDTANLSAAVREFAPQALVHLAAKADISAKNTWDDFASIHKGTSNVLAVTEKAGTIRRFANVSTQLVIGPDYAPRSLLDFKPYTLYGHAKAYAEAELLQWQASVPWLTFRPANIWGPYHPTFAAEIWRHIQSRTYLHPSGKAVLRSYGYVDNLAHQLLELLFAEPGHTNRQVFYGADSVLDSALWVDAFSVALTGRAARRIPARLLRTFGIAGDLVSLMGINTPINSGRAMRMTTDYPVPTETTLQISGPPSVKLEEGVLATVEWLKKTRPDIYQAS